LEQRKLGKTGMEVSVLGFGSAEIGYGNVAQSVVNHILGSALDAGLNVIDTAECYLDSEELIGKAVSHRRQDYYLFTKMGHASGIPGSDWDIKMLKASIDRSLKRLQTDYVDLLQLHSPSLELIQDGAVIELLLRAKEAGKTRYIGLSSDGAAALSAIRTGAFDTLQTSINIADQEAISLTLPEAAQRGMGVIAKRPIANAAWRTGSKPSEAYHHVYWDRLEQLNYPFLKQSLNISIPTALQFTLAQPGVATAIVGSTNPDRWRQNAGLLEQGSFTEDQMVAIHERWNEVSGGRWAGQR
jgi:aryl-alcohol dehydrogenase-like predicted oxidoreductase